MDKVKEDKKAKLREWIKEDRKKYPDKYINMDLVRHYGITLDEYNILLEKQNGVCAICGNTEKAVKNNSVEVRRLAVDHCHTTGKVRGLLCTHCNQGIGNFRDNVQYLSKAMSYIIENGP